MGNRECGADVDGGPVTADYAPGRVPAFTYCPPGGVLVENGAGVLVCSYGADR
jgi:hypothetical protein